MDEQIEKIDVKKLAEDVIELGILNTEKQHKITDRIIQFGREGWGG